MKKFVESLFGKMVLTAVVFIVIWPLLDFAWCALISHSAFEYSVYTHLVKPAVIAVVFSLIGHFIFK